MKIYNLTLNFIFAAVFGVSISICSYPSDAFANYYVESNEELQGLELGENLQPNKPEKKKSSRSVTRQILLYVPNRVFDILDIVRLRVRVGPGFGLGAQVTKAIRLDLGAYAALWLGLPGPRQERILPIPVGLESKAGLALSILEVSAGGDTGPEHSDSEIGINAQLAIIGFDLGIDVVEILDFAAGIFFLEIREDDL